MNGLIELDERLTRLRADTARIATCVTDQGLTRPVAACPGWDLRKLVVHLGYVQRWATYAVEHASAPPREAITLPDSDADPDTLTTWLRAGADTLARRLETTPVDAPTWHPFALEQQAWVWSRRQMMETAVHRWDAEMATSGASDLDTALGIVGVDEFLEVGLPRVLGRESIEPPTASLHIHCTDTGLAAGVGEWIVWNEGGDYRLAPEHRTGDAALRGRAVDMLLVLTGRADRSVLEVVGDPAAAAAWLDLPGW